MTDFHELFDRATDGLESPGLAADALQTAHRRRVRRRGAAAAALASGLVAAAVVATTQLGGSSAGPLPSDSTPTASPTPTASTPDVQGPWDPRRVDDLPAAPDSVASVLPELIDPPADSPLLMDAPVAAVALAVQTGTDGTAYLFGVDGSWRRLPIPGEFPNVSISPDGTRLVVWEGVLAFPATVIEVATGEALSLARPAGFQNSELNSWRFLSEDELRIEGGRTPFVFDAVSGEVEQTPGADPARVPTSLEGYGAVPKVRLSSVAANDDVIAGTTDDGGVAVVVADRRTLMPYAVLPIEARPDVFGGGKGLNLVGVTDDGTVLLRVNLVDLGRAGFDIVAWDPATGAVTRVSRTPDPGYVSYADALLR